ncbi:hypothetical protein HX004_10210 [Myroides sp. 1354]|uniref:hypothetical protein n=1 Tax=unclassified Myroides TaxID=2642485 RepID=UPI002576E050|nr:MULTISPECIES: hypothetical protein [unclassified Myroides]MDM1045261.1 hypothetical protein [Myroides sp. R163-1]MDM1056143.1 hypothetical protein [Myroides sp. 1354]MDM1069272.1 hypothetical protein [Myroides sp. 1372]
MALDKSKLETGIRQLLEDMMKREENSFDEFANRLATVIDTYVKEGEIEYLGGLANSGGAVTGTIQGTIK